jgi:hypothetical protein
VLLACSAPMATVDADHDSTDAKRRRTTRTSVGNPRPERAAILPSSWDSGIRRAVTK